MMFRVLAAAGVATVLAIPSSVNAQVLMQKELSARMAMTIAEAAWTECTPRVSVAVVDRAGRLKALIVGDGISPHNIELAERKAYTARTFSQPSADFVKRLTERPETVGSRQYTRVLALGGGLPIKAGNEVVGAVGVSGSPGKDDVCSQAGIDKVADLLK